MTSRGRGRPSSEPLAGTAAKAQEASQPDGILRFGSLLVPVLRSRTSEGRCKVGGTSALTDGPRSRKGPGAGGKRDGGGAASAPVAAAGSPRPQLCGPVPEQQPQVGAGRWRGRDPKEARATSPGAHRGPGVEEKQARGGALAPRSPPGLIRAAEGPQQAQNSYVGAGLPHRQAGGARERRHVAAPFGSGKDLTAPKTRRSDSDERHAVPKAPSRGPGRRWQGTAAPQWPQQPRATERERTASHANRVSTRPPLGQPPLDGVFQALRAGPLRPLPSDRSFYLGPSPCLPPPCPQVPGHPLERPPLLWRREGP